MGGRAEAHYGSVSELWDKSEVSPHMAAGVCLAPYTAELVRKLN